MDEIDPRHSPSIEWPDAGLLVLRVSVGLMLAFGHGIGKVPPSEGFVNGVANLGFPMPTLFAWGAGLSELVGSLLIAVGLLTRPAALMVAITMGVAAFLRHAGDPFETKEKALLYLAVAVAILIAGAGRYSLDRVIARRRA